VNKSTLSKLLCILSTAYCLVVVTPSSAQIFNTLLSFDESDGREPQLPPVQGVDGNLYGVAFAGGLNGAGTVYRITPEGVFSTLYNFCSQSKCTDGELPFDQVLAGTDGNLYGMTLQGGINGAGTVFKLTLEGVLTSIYSFCSQANCADGSSPNGILQATDGNFYGTTMTGGASSRGTIFKLTPQGAFTLLYSFSASYDYNESFSTLIQGTDGIFYGTTDVGGFSTYPPCQFYGCGTAFKITPQGNFTIIHNFCSRKDCEDGATPYWLIQAADGSFYGVAGSGGANKAIGGTIFRLTTKGELTTVYSFCAQSGCSDGVEPIWLVQAAGGGNFYGVTFRGGEEKKCQGGCGTAFEITSAGTLASLHSFDRTDGTEPYGLTQATNGEFYGVTSSGGTDGYGTIFSLSTGLAPFVETLPNAGQVGAKVTILGSDLAGTTNVSFHGAAATFTIVSSSEITTSVPAGATTGNVEVTTPSGTLSSDVVFRVE
jgi:uncharacterized repeat protein (TIGR03803 family)